jgi:uncharacterized membrane protein YeaQ/YmgE (transglycosylase-associated protein family)
MHVLGWITLGLIAGVVTKLQMAGRDAAGVIIAAVLGMAGALLGGVLGQVLGWYRERDAVGFVAALLGAILVMAIYHVAVTMSGWPRASRS